MEKKIFSSNPIYEIDAVTWEHIPQLGEKSRDGYLFAPRNLKKDQTFRFWYVSTTIGADMKFVSEEYLYGLKVYKFEKTNLEPVDQSDFFTHIPGVPEKKGVMLVNHLNLWIEPVSGHIVKQEEISDDYYFFDRATGKRLNSYNKFSNVYSEKSVIEHVLDARIDKYKVLAITYGIPLLIFLILFLPNILRYSVFSRTKKLKLLGLIISFLIIIASLVSAYFINKNVNDSEHLQLSDQADEIFLTIDRRLAAYIDILRGARGLLSSSSYVSRSEWASYISNLDLEKKYPGVLSMGYASAVDEDRKNDFLANTQKDGLKDFGIFPEKAMPMYVPIVYIEPPLERNLGVIGYNFYSDENRGDAIDRAAKTKDIAITSKIELLNEPTTDRQPGFLMYMPVFRNNNATSSTVFTKSDVVGYVFASFRMNDLMKNLLAKKKTDLDFHIYDGLRTDSESLLFDYNQHVNPDVKTIFTRIDVLNVGDRVWAVEFFNNPAFEVEKTKKLLPYVILVGGIIFSILFYLILYFLITTKERAVLIAEELTNELKKSEESLKEKNKKMEEQILESEKLNQVMVDRELAMIELKKKAK